MLSRRSAIVSSPAHRTLRAVGLAALLLAGPALQTAPGAAPAAEWGRHGMVVAPEPRAAEIGRDVLRRGGNAIDASVAVAFALSVTYPLAGSLGGGGFLLYRTEAGEHHALDFRETTPAGLSAELFLDEEGRPVPELSRRSGLAVGVPGSVAGLAEAHRLWGSLPWSELVRPAVELAARGWPVSRRLNRQLREDGAHLRNDDAAARVFAPGGEWPEPGSLLVQRDLARTLRLVAERGADGFYRGRVAEEVARAVRAAGGRMTTEDLAGYRPLRRQPLVGRYRGHTVVSFPPPSSGGVILLQILQMLERFDLAAFGPGSSRTVHVMVEAERRAYADRSRWLGDPDFWENPVAGLLDPDYVALRAATIDPRLATPSERVQPGNPPRPESEQTHHFSVTDARGRAVALTATLNGAFGSGIVAGDTGVLLNNEIDDFALAPGAPNQYGLLGGEANALRGGKRPLSSMAPTIVESPAGGERPLLVLGSPGGATIISSVLQVVVNVIDHGMPLQEAVNAPRFHHQWQPDELVHEVRAFPADVLEALRLRGHRSVVRERPLGNVNAIGIDGDGAWLGAADPRRESAAVGY